MSVLVIAEHREGELREITLEALGAAAKLNAGEVKALVPGSEIEFLTRELSLLCSEVIELKDPRLDPPLGEPWLKAILDFCASEEFQVILLGATSWGMELAPALAESLEAPFAPDVTALEYGENLLKGSRMVYSGKLEAKWQCENASTCVATVRPGAFDPPEPGAEAKIREVAAVLPDDQAVKFLGYLKQAAGDVDITAAKILVSVGRGIGGPENIALAQDLADALGGVVSCSRPVADKRWLDKSRQVGTSGQTVKPDIYLALGISGAFQHLAGMQSAKTIIALNKDPKAPIFGVAHYGIVGDILELLPLITEKVAAICAA